MVADGRTFAYVLYDDGATAADASRRTTSARSSSRRPRSAPGIDLLVEHSGFTDFADIRLAGAFGAHIDPVDAMVLGLIPDAPRAAVARRRQRGRGRRGPGAACRGAQRAEIAAAVRRVTKIETATEPRFQELFVAAMAFPHATAPTPHLAGAGRRCRTRAAGTGRRRSRPRRARRATR